jgi:hypothetical protein
LLGLAETAPYFHDGRFATLSEVVSWFDREHGLQLSAVEQADLVAYLEAVGAVDRPRDDRPLARRLDESFAYVSLLTARRSRRVWIAALDSVSGALARPPPALAARVAGLQRELAGLRARVLAGAPLAPLATRAQPLRLDLARLAADWAGAVSTPVAEPARTAR